MCRLLGISYGDKREALSTSQIASILFERLVKGGPHAYGWMSYSDSKDNISTVKSPGRADTTQAQRHILSEVDDDARWFVGHTRYATDGDPSENQNNHPIWHGDICGVHNGVLSGWKSILKITGREDDTAKVDSEAIFAAVNRWGPVNGLKKIHGSMVTIYTNLKKPHLLHLARTTGRSITLGWTDYGNLIWASEESALLELERYGVRFTRLSKVSENRLLIIRDGKIIQKHRFRPLPPEPKAPTIGDKKFPALSAGRSVMDYNSFEWDDEDGLKALPSALDADGEVNGNLKDNDDDFYISQALLRAQRRGRKMKSRLRNSDGSRKYVFYQGQYISADEYAEILTHQKS